jgi:hypothetical protein
MRKIFLLIMLLSINGYSQDIQKLNSKYRFKDFCKSDKIASVKLDKTGFLLSEPVIRLNSGETVTLSFDEILNDGDEGDYYYTLEHKDADWQDDNLSTHEYMTGFMDNPFENIRYSQGTRVVYRHFSLTLPNNDVALKVSGNYLVKVFDRNTEQLALAKGFSVVEPSVIVDASVLPPNGLTCMQLLSVKVGHRNLPVRDAYMNLKLRIEQNQHRMPDACNPILAFSYPDYTDYTRPDKNLFKGQNEFRSFDTRSLDYNGIGVASRLLTDNGYQINLMHDMEHWEHVPNQDINGRYMVAADKSESPEVEADYVNVLFSFAPVTPFAGRVFLFGELTNWAISDKYELFYRDNSYKRMVLLKQGIYNYQYAIVKANGDIDLALSENCFPDTENEYCVYVYFRGQADRYDRLTGFKKISTHR